MSQRLRINPPQLPVRILDWYCTHPAVEDLIGDMDELFYRNIQKMHPLKAKMKYWGQAMALLFSYGLRKRKQKQSKKGYSQNNFAMFKNYFKVGIRSLAKQKLFTILNVLGLSIGMSLGLLALASYVDMLEVDQFHEKKDRIYRVITQSDDLRTVDFDFGWASTTEALAAALLEEAPAVEQAVRFNDNFNENVILGNTEIPVRGYYTDANFFDVFSFELVKGNPANALDGPFNIVVTENTAKKLFGNADPMGKLITVGSLGNFQITGVIREAKRTHFLFDVLVSFETLPVLEQQELVEAGLGDWNDVVSNYVYLLFNDQNAAESTKQVLDKISERQYNDPDKFEARFYLQAITDISTGEELNNDIGLVWGFWVMILFFFLSLLILLPACLNYANLSISRSLKRAKEIGLRKVVGGQKQQIFMQFIIETSIISIISLIGALYIFVMVRSEFKAIIIEGARTFDLEITTPTFLAFLGFGLFTALFAGLIPAHYFSKLNPIDTLRGTVTAGSLAKIGVRKVLLVGQFSLSLFFIMAVSIMLKQHMYALTYDFGFTKENILDVQLKGLEPNLVRSEFGRLADVNSISFSSSIAGSWMSSNTFFWHPETNDSVSTFQMYVDHNYIPNLELQLLVGENFQASVPNNEDYIIVNEKFLEDYGFDSPHEALGSTVLQEDDSPLTIRGVVKDFNFMPLREQITAFCFRYNPQYYAFANLKITSSNIEETLSQLDQTWEKLAGDITMEAKFLDDTLEEALVGFRSMVKIFGFLGILAVSISCLGLLGMVVYSSENRIKEIGVRKVMGANSFGLTMMLSGGFFKMMVIACFIAIPIAYFFFDLLFLNMAYYRTNIGIVEIAGSTAILFILGIATVASQTVKAARANPVDSLRYE